MDYTDRYINRLKRKGTNSINATINKSKQIINAKFHTSPSFVVVKINGIDTDSIVNNDTKYDEKLIFFRPDIKVDMGSIIEYKNSKYLLMSFVDNGISPKGELKLCNETFILSGAETRTQIGTTPFDDPIWNIVAGEPISIPCITKTTIQTDDTDEAINLPEGRTDVIIPFTEHADLTIGKQFELYGEQYNIIGIDKTKQINGVGLLVIQGKKV